MRSDRRNFSKLCLASTIVAFALVVGPQASYGAEIFRCTAWTNGSLSHRGPVTIALDADALTWRADTASSTAQSIRDGGTFSAYVDDAFVYLVFGTLFFETGMVSGPLTVRRVPFVRENPRIGEIECN